ncbi:hypothetical protein B0T44_14355 [Nocardia donostiensis]|uniref:AB hydrolase-1 domain-containing protein n=1 Tax=Nocardia donostiensis TaxID=1538463 RepID=A0A1W0AZH4_9NOCA|nr:hypothetical protein B0T46_02620 [Nocardia donostiensis]OQS15677.1 hypothetical protein B0T36_06700 [Nocardia donostiensis]OQS19383.1 hypothetical protein B0T44_14355 [Nocardia donostiensis]
MTSIYRSAEGQRVIRAWCERRLDEWDVRHRRWNISTAAGPTSVVAVGTETPGPRPPVVVVPGTNMNTAVCLDFLAALAARWPVIALDVPGQPGLSAEQRPRKDRMDWYGRWLSEVVEHVSPGRVVVAGHSLGGAIALACPSDRIAARVLVAPAGLMRLSVPPKLLAATGPWLVTPGPVPTRRLLEQMTAPGGHIPEHLCDWMTLVARHCRTSLAPAPLDSATLADQRTAPCVVATGAHDVFLPPRRLGPAVRRRLGADLHTLEGCGHLALDEDPERIVDLVSGVTM